MPINDKGTVSCINNHDTSSMKRIDNSFLLPFNQTSNSGILIGGILSGFKCKICGYIEFYDDSFVEHK